MLEEQIHELDTAILVVKGRGRYLLLSCILSGFLVTWLVIGAYVLWCTLVVLACTLGLWVYFGFVLGNLRMLLVIQDTCKDLKPALDELSSLQKGIVDYDKNN